MSAKARRRGGKYSAPEKKKKSRRRPGTAAPRPDTVVSPAAVVSQAAGAAVLSPKAAPQTSEMAKKSTAMVAGHPDITAELRRVGILAAVMLAILVILALVLA